MVRNEALLVVFGSLGDGDLRLSGDAIYRTLAANNLWFVARIPRDLTPGTPTLFYESKIGFRGTAILDSIGRTTADDQSLVGRIPIKLYPYKLVLERWHDFAIPVDPRPHLAQLSFVSNKKHWGHSFRSSPRIVPMADFRIIADSTLAKAGPRSRRR